MLVKENAALLLIDMQGKLAQSMFEPDMVLENCAKLIQAAKLFEMPILILEQYPKGLGPTAPSLRELLGDQPAIEKVFFSACDSEEFQQQLRDAGRRQILVAGIEAHVCVYQTVRDLLKQPYEVHVASDAVSSRTEWNRNIALERMREMGAVITSTEMALFEMMRAAKGDLFKPFAQIVK